MAKEYTYILWDGKNKYQIGASSNEEAISIVKKEFKSTKNKNVEVLSISKGGK